MGAIMGRNCFDGMYCHTLLQRFSRLGTFWFDDDLRQTLSFLRGAIALACSIVLQHRMSTPHSQPYLPMAVMGWYWCGCRHVMHKIPMYEAPPVRLCSTSRVALGLTHLWVADAAPCPTSSSKRDWRCDGEPTELGKRLGTKASHAA